MNVLGKSFWVAMLLIGLTGVSAQNIEGTIGSKQNDPKMQWWNCLLYTSDAADE